MGSDCLTFDAGLDCSTFDKGSSWLVELVNALDPDVLKGSPNEKKCQEYCEKTLCFCGFDGCPSKKMW